MPHECTNCGRTFPDGSKEMLSGCPDCGGNKFQFAPSRSTTPESDGSATPDSGAAATSDEDASEADPGWDSESGFTRATETVRNWVTSADDDADVIDHSEATAGADSAESSAQSDRSNAVSQSEQSEPTTPSERSEPSAQPNQSTSDSESDQSTSGSQPDQSTSGSQSDQSWPSSETEVADSSTQKSSEFTEWPETARRPEDRSPSERPDDRDPADQSSSSRSPITESEDSAQADARSGVVSNDDIPTGTVEGTAETGHDRNVESAADGDHDQSAGGNDHPPDHGRVVSEPTGDQPSIEELRAELNEQFESIKIVSPGQYELNLMELYNREEYIISLQEDGRYVIDVPDSWREPDE